MSTVQSQAQEENISQAESVWIVQNSQARVEPWKYVNTCIMLIPGFTHAHTYMSYQCTPTCVCVCVRVCARKASRHTFDVSFGVLQETNGDGMIKWKNLHSTFKDSLALGFYFFVEELVFINILCRVCNVNPFFFHQEKSDKLNLCAHVSFLFFFP